MSSDNEDPGTHLIADSKYLLTVSVPQKYVGICFACTPIGGPGVLSHSSNSRAVDWSNCIVGRELLILKQGSLTSSRKRVQFKADIILIKPIQTIFAWNGTLFISE